MGISALRDLSKKVKTLDVNIDLQYGLNSSSNWVFYSAGNGKSTTALTQIDPTEEPILCISPAGASMHLRSQFPNAVIKTAATLDELEVIIKDLEVNFSLMKTIQRFIDSPKDLETLRDTVFIPNYYKANEAAGKEDFNYMFSLVSKGKFIFSRVVLEEIDVISAMIQNALEERFKVEILGEDKKRMGMDWNELSKDLVAYYSRWMRLPCQTIFCTSDKLPSERKDLSQIIPAICTGSAQRLLTSLVGNVLYFSNTNDGYFVQIKPTPDVFIRSKFLPMGADMTKVPTKIDITNNPQAFWQFVDDCQQLKIPMLKPKK